MTDAASPSEVALDLQAQLIDACLDDDVRKVRELVKQHGAVVDEPDAEGRVALLDANADPRRKVQGWSPLDLARRDKREELVKLIIDHLPPEEAEAEAEAEPASDVP